MVEDTLTKPNQFSSTLPPHTHTRATKIYSDNTAEANILNDYFKEQPSLYDRNKNLPAVLYIPYFTLNSISITDNEVESVPKALQTGKASGPGAINVRMLKVSQALIVSSIRFFQCIPYQGSSSSFLEASQGYSNS